MAGQWSSARSIYTDQCGMIDLDDLLYNNARKRVGLIGFWDRISSDEVGSVKIGSAQVINLTTGSDDATQRKEAEEKLKMIGASLLDHGIKLNVKFSDTLHDREILLDNGWTIQIGRGFDIYQKLDNWFSIGTSDLEMRPCMETKADIFRRTCCWVTEPDRLRLSILIPGCALGSLEAISGLAVASSRPHDSPIA